MATTPKIVSRKTVAKNLWTHIVDENIEFPDGRKGNYLIVERGMALAIIPLFFKEGVLCTTMVKQYRHPIGTEVLQFPMGCLEEDSNPEDHARKELQQETGLEMQELTLIAEYYVDPGLSRQRCMVFVAKGLAKEGEQNLEETEIGMKIAHIPVAELVGMIERREICDSWGLSQVYLLQRYLSDQQ